jgi:hypothetical protein
VGLVKLGVAARVAHQDQGEASQIRPSLVGRQDSVEKGVDPAPERPMPPDGLLEWPHPEVDG